MVMDDASHQAKHTHGHIVFFLFFFPRMAPGGASTYCNPFWKGYIAKCTFICVCLYSKLPRSYRTQPVWENPSCRPMLFQIMLRNVYYSGLIKRYYYELYKSDQIRSDQSASNGMEWNVLLLCIAS